MCDCVKTLNKELSEQMKSEGELQNVGLFSHKLFSVFEYMQGKRNKSIRVLYSYCPFCGKEYSDEVQP